MRLLALETSGDPASVALVVDGKVEGEVSFPSRTALSRSLPEHIQAVLGGAPTPGSVDALAVSLGPGSFTGLRVGVALMKALAHVLGVPLLGVPTHEVVACRVPCGDGVLWVIQHAREMDLYVSRFHACGAAWAADGPCRVMSVTALGAKLAATGGPLRVVGEGLERHGETLHAAAPEALQLAPELWLPQASSVGRIALSRVAQADPDAVWNLHPIYVLASQAERAQGVDLGLS
jgi:tRNA threonylcarbamoyladenosine biosynthesis protein TsaB